MVKTVLIDFFLLSVLLMFYCINITGLEDSSYWDQFNLKRIKINMSEDDYLNIIKQQEVNEWYPATFETDSISENMIVRRHGNTAREEPKISIKTIRNNKTVVYSSQFYDKSFCRYRLSDYLFRKAGFKTANVEPILFFINDIFMGLYLEREGIDSTFLAENNFNTISVYQVNSGGELTYSHGMNVYSAFKKKIPNNDQNYSDLEELITTIDKVSSGNNIESLENILDVYQALDYYAVSIISSNYDGIIYNYYLINNINTKKFEFLPWDLDRTFKGAENELPVFSNGLFEKLLEHKTYRDYTYKRIIDLFNKDELLDTLNLYHSQIEQAYYIDPILSMNPSTLSEKVTYIEHYIERINNFLDTLNN